MTTPQRPDSVFAAVGGHATFTTLVDAFYASVAQDEFLISMYPEGHELDGAKHRLQTFLEQYFGGPTTYQEERGHPRLRMRHNPRLTRKQKSTGSTTCAKHWTRSNFRLCTTSSCGTTLNAPPRP